MSRHGDSFSKGNTSINPSEKKVHKLDISPVLLTRRQNDSPKDTEDESIVFPSIDNEGNSGGTEVKDNEPFSWRTSKERFISSTHGTRSSTRNIIKEVLE